MLKSFTYRNLSIEPARTASRDAYVVQSLPRYRDIAKAIAIVVTVVTAARLSPHCALAWLSNVLKPERMHPSHIAAESPVTESLHDVVQQKEQCTEHSPPERRERSVHHSSIAVRVKFAAQPEPRMSPRSARESPAPCQIPEQPSEPSSGQPSMKYFDNAGKLYATRTARDAAENKQIAASLRRFSAMKPEQRTIMRDRAFARLATLDMQQRNNMAP